MNKCDPLALPESPHTARSCRHWLPPEIVSFTSILSCLAGPPTAQRAPGVWTCFLLEQWTYRRPPQIRFCQQERSEGSEASAAASCHQVTLK